MKKLKLIIACLVLAIAVGIIFSITKPDTQPKPVSGDAKMNLEQNESTCCEWFQGSNKGANGVVVVVHGLNNKPEIMNPIVQYLNNNNFDVCRVALEKHGKNIKQGSQSLETIWLQNIEEAFRLCQNRRPNEPVCVVAYSLGALIVVKYIDENPTPVSNMVLFAPAVRLTCKSQMMRPLASMAGSTKISIPSLAPKKYRARSSTPLAEYKAMFSMVDEIKRLENNDRHSSIPTKIFASPDDELVSYAHLATWIERNSLSHWKIVEVSVSPSATYNHLIVAPESFANEKWEEISQSMLEHLKQ